VGQDLLSFMDKFFASESSLIESLSEFMRKLNDEESALVVVEGLRDAKALREAGYGGELFMLCHKNNVLTLEETASQFRKVILLLDNDREGKKLSERTRKILGARVRIDTFYQRELLPASKGRIRHVEELAPFAQRLSRHV
jgi:5S rRNA maturation endonuclease (ribonuclease M5)